MTTKWADSFEDVASGAANFATDYTYSAGTGLNVGTGRRSSTQALSTTNGSLTRSVGGTEATMFQSIAVNPGVLVAGGILDFMEGATTHVQIRSTAAGALQATRGSGGTVLGTSASGLLSVGTWYWFQVRVTIHDTTGTVEIRDGNGNVVLNLTGQDTRNASTGYCDTVKLTGMSSAAHLYDDWHVWDTTGAVCNTWTNDTRIDHKLPSDVGNSAQFSPSAGSNFQCVDDPTWNTTDYVESSTAGHKDTYAFGDLSHSPPNIFAVVRTALAQKDDAGARSLKLVTRRAGTDYAGSAIGLTQGSYVRCVDVQETDPSTSAAWTQAGFNAAEFGFENV